MKILRLAILPLIALGIIIGLFTGCGGEAASIVPTGSTNVMLLITSTANDNLVYFGLKMASIALADSAGRSSSTKILTL